MSDPYMEDLSDLDEEYEAAEPEERKSFGPLMPDGPQQALLVDLDIRRRQSDDHRQLYMKFQNMRGEVRDWRDLDAENGIGLRIAKGDLQLLGFDGRMSQLPGWIMSGAWKGLVCNINKKTRPGDTRDFIDVYVNGCYGLADDPSMFDIDPRQAAAPPPQQDGGGSGYSHSDDDIPF